MKFRVLVWLIMLSNGAFAQGGLEGIFVEEYYTVDQEDCEVFKTDVNLEPGSKTYRIYVDLLPGYYLQAVYGAPGHPLFFKSTGLFYNHPESGTTHPNILPERALADGVTLLDSWISIGAAGENHFGIPRYIASIPTDSTLKIAENFINHKGKKEKLQLKEANGMVRSYHLPYPTFFQIDSCLKYLGSATLSDSLVVHNGAWASLGRGAVGADSTGTNMVLIAQLTTNGDLSFELNIQVGDEFGNSTKYVARNAGYKEIEHPALVYSSGKKKKNKKKKQSKS